MKKAIGRVDAPLVVVYISAEHAAGEGMILRASDGDDAAVGNLGDPGARVLAVERAAAPNLAHGRWRIPTCHRVAAGKSRTSAPVPRPGGTMKVQLPW
jgi:hypothetical protein